MKKIPPTSTFIVLGALSLAAACAGVWFLYAEIGKKSAEITAFTSSVAEVELREARSTSLRAALRDTEALRSELAGYLLKEEGVPAFFATLEQAGRATGAEVELRNASVAPVEGSTPGAGIEELRFEISVMGSLESTTRVIALVEALPNGVRVDAASLSADEDQWSALVHVSVPKAVTK